jgi:hypothetical protein
MGSEMVLVLVLVLVSVSWVVIAVLMSSLAVSATVSCLVTGKL